MTETPPLVLLVEDHPGDARLVVQALAQTPARPRVLHIRSGSEAAQLLLRGEGGRRVDLVLLDLNLPGVPGEGVLTILRDCSPHVPIVVYTTSSEPEEVRRAYAGGANCFLTKPADPLEIESLMAAVVGFWLDPARLTPGDGRHERWLSI
ncbi:MAG: response regulator [Gemmatimonadota bacterium]